MITIPESVAYYWRDPINMAAVNVLAGSTDVPADLGLDEAERFELATLAAHRIRVDFWRLLRHLWSATWGEAVRTAMPSARLLTYGQHQVFTSIDPYADPSVDYAWETRTTSGVFVLPDQRKLFTRVMLTEQDREVALQFYLDDEDWTTSDDLSLGSDWTDDGDHRRTTGSGLLPLAHPDGEVDSEPAAKFAQDAIASLVAAL